MQILFQMSILLGSVGLKTRKDMSKLTKRIPYFKWIEDEAPKLPYIRWAEVDNRHFLL